jgi:hypothetical protein
VRARRRFVRLDTNLSLDAPHTTATASLHPYLGPQRLCSVVSIHMDRGQLRLPDCSSAYFRASSG